MSNEKDNTPVFEEIERKMKYGAPELQKFYQKYLTKGLIFAIILHLILVSGYAFALYMDKVRSEKDKDEMQKREITLEDLDIPPPIEDIPIEEPKAVALKDLSALVPEPVAKKLVTEEVKLKSQKELEEVKLPVASTGTDDPSKVNPNAEFTGKVEEKKVEQKLKRRKRRRRIFSSSSRLKKRLLLLT